MKTRYITDLHWEKAYVYMRGSPKIPGLCNCQGQAGIYSELQCRGATRVKAARATNQYAPYQTKLTIMTEMAALLIARNFRISIFLSTYNFVTGFQTHVNLVNLKTF